MIHRRASSRPRRPLELRSRHEREHPTRIERQPYGKTPAGETVELFTFTRARPDGQRDELGGPACDDPGPGP